MEVEVLYFEGCPSHTATVEIVRDTIDRLDVDAEVREIEVETDEKAEELEFLGSPSVRVDGDDIEPGASSSDSFGRRCRVYATDSGTSGVPPRAMIEAALKGESYEGESSGPKTASDCCSSDGRPKVQLLVAEWCPQCPAAKKFWTGLAEEEDFILEIIDVESDEGGKLAAEHGIRGVPATLVDGNVEFRDRPTPARAEALALLDSQA